MIGTSLSHYRITAKLGQGGMGEVYRATDDNLGRDVAIKVLPDEVARDEERLARFRREAHLLASLNHTNIAAIHGLEEADGKPFLVLELVEGEDLSERLRRSAIPVDEAMEIASQIAEALEEAHGHGIVHRDLKPANIKIAPDGRVKVLDFGLAKAFAGEEKTGSSSDLTQSPTMSAQATQAGVILGTAAYMSPEQARGKPVDKRADIWAYGVVLFEMLTGKQLFAGETVSDVLAAVLTRDPGWESLPPGTPASARRLLSHCLQRDVRRRLRDIGDASLLLAEAPDPTAPGPARSTGHLQRLLATAVILSLAAVALSLWLRAPVADRGARISKTSQLTDLPGAQMSPSLSADGDQLLYVAEDGGDTDIFLQRVGGENAINLTSDYPDDDFDPAFSPDRRRIAFASRREGGGIFVMGATGESPQRVSDTGSDPAWSPDARFLLYTTERITDPYSRLGPAQLWRIDLETLERERVSEQDVAGARWSPSGRRIAYWSHYAIVQGQRDIWTMAADGTDAIAVTDDTATDWNPFWSPDGRWLYFISDRGGRPNLWRAPIDEHSGRVEGAVAPVTSGVSYVAEAAMAADGRRIAVSITRETGEIALADFDPTAERLIEAPVTFFRSTTPLQRAHVSADGEWIVLSTKAPRETLVVMRTDGTARRRILDDEHRNRGPRWSPDGRWIAFYSNRGGTYTVWAVRPNGTDLRQVTDASLGGNQPMWSRDGQRVVISGRVGVEVIELGPDGLGGVSAPRHSEVVDRGGALFIATALAPDGEGLAGLDVDARGERVLAIGGLGRTGLSIPLGPSGRPFRPAMDVTWLDNRRVAFWDVGVDAALIWDRETQTARVIPGVRGPANLQFLDDGRKLLITRYPFESDIWMLTLEDIDQPQASE